MAPYFLRNLLPKKERVERARPLWEVLGGLTWAQWGLFFSGWPCAAIDLFCVDLAAGAFCFQFAVQGAFSIVPIFLLEISPPAFRSTFPGVTYQLGYMIALTSDPIGIALAKRFLVTFPPTEIIQEAPDFGILQAIFVGSAVAYLIPLALIGPENHGSRFERSKMAFQVGASRDEVDSIPEEVDGVQGFEMSSVWGEGFGEKGRPVH